nr:alpha/beta hydrolase [Oscillochloris trichoides]
MPHNDDPPSPIRRGQGIRLSTRKPAPLDPPAAAPPHNPDTPIARGRGLRLTSTPETRAPHIRRGAMQMATGSISYLQSGSGPALILLHGFGASSNFWRGVLHALSPLHACYAPDLPGFGNSPARSNAPTLESLAYEILAFADALGLDEFDLVGHALGAAVAATVAGLQPDRINRLVLTSLALRPFAPELLAMIVGRSPFDAALTMARPVLDLWRPWASLAMRAKATSQFLAAQLLAGPPGDEQLWQSYLVDFANADGRAALTTYAAHADPTLIASLEAIRAPTLLISGKADRIARPNQAAAILERIPGAQLALLESCGHLPPIEFPDAYHTILNDFLQ